VNSVSTVANLLRRVGGGLLSRLLLSLQLLSSQAKITSRPRKCRVGPAGRSRSRPPSGSKMRSRAAPQSDRAADRRRWRRTTVVAPVYLGFYFAAGRAVAFIEGRYLKLARVVRRAQTRSMPIAPNRPLDTACRAWRSGMERIDAAVHPASSRFCPTSLAPISSFTHPSGQYRLTSSPPDHQRRDQRRPDHPGHAGLFASSRRLLLLSLSLPLFSITHRFRFLPHLSSITLSILSIGNICGARSSEPFACFCPGRDGRAGLSQEAPRQPELSSSGVADRCYERPQQSSWMARATLGSGRS